MKRAIIVRCKKCSQEWYVRESRENEFESPVTITCPQCHTIYKKINYKELFVSKCSKFSLLRVMHSPHSYKRTVRSSFAFVIIVLIVILLISVFSYIVLHP